jgi:hypothetical protein
MGVSWRGLLTFSFEYFPFTGVDAEHVQLIAEIELFIYPAKHQEFVIAVNSNRVLDPECTRSARVIIDRKQLFLL